VTQIAVDCGAAAGVTLRIQPAPRSFRSVAGLLACCGAIVGLAGCNTESFFDPSVYGRWERTPTKVPILNRIASIESEGDEFVEYTDVSREDLVPEIRQYRLGPGDRLQITMWDIPNQGQPTPLERDIDTQGFVELPQLGEVFVSGRTIEGAREAIAAAMAQLVVQPLVSVVVQARRQQVFHIFGQVQNPGTYTIPAAEYRLLEAMTAAGAFPQTALYVYVIRQIPLESQVEGRPTGAAGAPSAPGTQPQPQSGENLLNLIDQLSKPPQPGQSPPPPPPPPAPSGQPKPAAPGGSMGVLGGSTEQPATPPRTSTPTTQPSGSAPPVDLVEPPRPGQPSGGPAPATPPAGAGGDTSWVFLNGKWVQVARPGMPSAPAGTPGAAVPPLPLVTQRIIRIPVRSLISGDARYNIVIRPGDIIRVAVADQGQIYVGGQVQRPGVFNLPEAGRLTLIRAIDAAGGLSSIAIPERVDLTRMVGNDQQATIRLDLRAIGKQTQPDVYLKPDDRINVGTNFWALPLAVIRQGFRASYGFGFILDRNFGSDVFGVPPEARARLQ
jgi:polysaccharide export outer membrane protein